MDRDVIIEKLESLRHCLNRIEAKRPDALEQLLSDIDLQDIIVLNLTRAIQVCVDIGSHILSNTEARPPCQYGRGL
ncbi:MAG: HepT-like ribonuclease domain-containing protein [Gammaproteobacteria bacterium]